MMKHILMVDDNTTNLKSAADVLKSGYQLSMAKSGKQALAFLKKTIPDLILLDILMPEMDGYETMEQIKLDPRTANVPVIFLTADTENDSEMKGLRMGALDFITKPFEADVMLSRIEKVLQMEDMRLKLSGAKEKADTNVKDGPGREQLSEMVSHVDHTNLKAVATMADIRKLCDEAISLGCASVCIPPAYVSDVKREYGDKVKICTVIGFPLGYNTTAAKIFEAENAMINGADEIDMVINIGRMKAGEYGYVGEEILALRKCSAGRILKVIIETCYLNEDEIIKACELVTEAGADYIKTSTGFGSAGATLENVLLMKEHIGSNVKIKAAGGIRDAEALASFYDAGCDRIGASATMEIFGKKE